MSKPFLSNLGMALLATGFVVTSAPARSAPAVLPALVQPADHEDLAGKMILAELVTPDLATSEKFYGAAFGWTFQDTRMGTTEVAEAATGGQPVAIMVRRAMAPGTHQQSAWLTFLAVHDADAATAAATKDGARVLFGPRTVPDLGREAVLSDPQGAVFAILASSSGDPPDVLAKPGAWIWSSLFTHDPDADAAFYQTLFGYDVFDLSGDQDARHLILASGGYARASANPLASNQPNEHPHWLSFIRVDDASAAAAKVVSLGGRVLVAPRMDRQGGQIAVVTDPLGAPFGLMEWNEPANPGQAQ